FAPLFLLFHCHRCHRALPSFPTRRSSDLDGAVAVRCRCRAVISFGRTAPAPTRIPAVAEEAGQTDRRYPGGAFHWTGSSRGRCGDRKSTRLNSSHVKISYAVFCLKKKRE